MNIYTVTISGGNATGIDVIDATEDELPGIIAAAAAEGAKVEIEGPGVDITEE